MTTRLTAARTLGATMAGLSASILTTSPLPKIAAPLLVAVCNGDGVERLMVLPRDRIPDPKGGEFGQVCWHALRPEDEDAGDEG